MNGHAVPTTARERLAREQQQRERRRRQLQAAGGAIVAVLLVAVVVVVVGASGRAGGPSTAADTARDTSSTTPRNTEGPAIPVGSGNAPVIVDVFYDYLCPYCADFEAANGAELDALVEEGVVQLNLRPLSFLDRASSGTQYSTRAANAVATVADSAPDRVLDFHAALFASQPIEGGAGHTDDELADLAVAAGVPQDTAARFAEGAYATWVADVTQHAFDSDGITGTPTVRVDGVVFDGNLYAPGDLTEAVRAAAGRSDR
ncbi:thioredoxin domain-containing protein [Nocardioides sp. zg-1228]|uniref:DsbA family protein n=1 Tax=Nocardioides sp. zg-1228 TaxID=2763008 RepID=UPI0016430750|nr:thioredoxin domain-containing protein [Nocardioides sp. zg-1228]MBC2933161.1 thioredoxin domain-containing protein [Nocardioides sp. zg-1228]QSF56660.1 thioredoxin domain-containing protein [Nocardioides sp. zg-1228]